MFKHAKRREVLWPVTIEVPRDDGSGLVDKAEIKCRYVLLTRSEMQQVAREAQADAGLLDDSSIERDDAWLASRITDWEGIVDAASGAAITYSPEALREVIDAAPYVRARIVAGLWEASRGAPAKN